MRMNLLYILTNEELLRTYLLALDKELDDVFVEMLRNEWDYRVLKNWQTLQDDNYSHLVDVHDI